MQNLLINFYSGVVVLTWDSDGLRTFLPYLLFQVRFYFLIWATSIHIEPKHEQV